MVSRNFLLGAFLWIFAAQAQGVQVCSYGHCLETHVQPTHGVKYGFKLPTQPSAAFPNELIGRIEVPAAVGQKWHGITLTGSYNLSPLIVAWPNPTFTGIVFTTRYANGYGPPIPYAGPTITTLEAAFSGSAWRWTFKCQGCLSWSSVGPSGPAGSLNTGGIQVLGWALGPYPPVPLSPTTTSIPMLIDFGMWGINLAAAQTAAYPA